LLWLLFFGCAGVSYALPSLFDGEVSSWAKVLQFLAILFTFGVWAGIVFIGESENWLPRSRRFVNAALFGILAAVVTKVFTSLSSDELLMIGTMFAIPGYFAESWLPHV
jgi:uncharacterized YccA/Bax inhibitor family protein